MLTLCISHLLTPAAWFFVVFHCGHHHLKPVLHQSHFGFKAFGIIEHVSAGLRSRRHFERGCHELPQLVVQLLGGLQGVRRLAVELADVPFVL